MKVYKKCWPENSYWHVYHTKMTGTKTGRLYGIKYWNGEMTKRKIDKIPGVMKRGVWQFDTNGVIDVSEKELQDVEEADRIIQEEWKAKQAEENEPKEEGEEEK